MKPLWADTFYVTSAEDIVLHKLCWYRDGGEVSERQWQDVIGVLRVQEGHLDMEYLYKWASELDVRDLLERASLKPREHDRGRDNEKVRGGMPAHELF